MIFREKLSFPLQNSDYVMWRLRSHLSVTVSVISIYTTHVNSNYTYYTCARGVVITMELITCIRDLVKAKLTN